MLKISTKFIFSFVFCLISLSWSQNNWIKYPGNPVLAPGVYGEWDQFGVSYPQVIYKNGLYHLWYTSWNYIPASIGYATSTDGVTWTKYNDSTTTAPPYAYSDPVGLRIGLPGDWDQWGVAYPAVLWNESDSLYHAWYVGWWDSYSNGYGSIGYATSPDGINWTKYNDTTTTNPPYVNSDPVLNFGPPGSWDGRWINAPCVLIIDGMYHMWYTGYAGWGSLNRIGYATSPDGINWTKYSGNPVLDPVPGAWDFPEIRSSRVIYNHTDSTYHMWYGGGSYLGRSVGHATSKDGKVWLRDSLNPVLIPGAPGTWEDLWVNSFAILLNTPDSIKTWYSGYDGQIASIGYATNPLCRLQTTPGTISHTLQPGITIMDSLMIENTGNTVANDLIFNIDSSGVEWLQFQSPLNHTLASGESIIVYFTINTTALPPDSHRTSINVKSNDFFWSRKKIPVQLEVLSGLKDNTALPLEFSLKQNYPNPFNPRTTIAFHLPQTGEVTLKIYNVLGEEIATLLSASLPSGFHSIEWIASTVASGVYLYRLEAEGYVETRKLVLMK